MYKKAEYKITVNKNGKIKTETRNGYIFTAYGIDFGICKRDFEWVVTDIKTGFLVACAGTRKEAAAKINAEICGKIKNAYKGAQKYIDMIAAA